MEDNLADANGVFSKKSHLCKNREKVGTAQGMSMAQFFAGTSGWAYPTWKPDFYPAKLAQKKFLGHYATKLNTVEVNFTFRQLVKETTIQNWLRRRPRIFASASRRIRSSRTSSG